MWPDFRKENKTKEFNILQKEEYYNFNQVRFWNWGECGLDEEL